MTLELDRLTRFDELLDKEGNPSMRFQLIWQQTMERIEEAITDLATQLALIQAAQAAADAAQEDATEAAREAARVNSYTDPTNVLSSTDLGGSTGARITVAGHDRIYPVQGTIDVPDITIVGADVGGEPFSYATQYSVYYDDTTLADTTPAFVAVVTSTNHADAQVGAAAGRHFVGVITTDTDGGGGTSGSGGSPPGGGGGTVLP